MAEGSHKKRRSADLCRRAEEAAKLVQERKEASSKDLPGLIQELQVYQAELEIQNEELRRSQEELTELKEEYTDLYEGAPCGYLTISSKGIIRHANLAALNLLSYHRDNLSRMTFSAFLDPCCQDAYYTALKKTGATGDNYQIELAVRQHQNKLRWVLADIRAELDDSRTVRQWRLTLTDIHERKKAEETMQRITRIQSLRSEIGRIFLQTREEPTLLNRACETIFQEERYRLAWIGYAENDPDKTVRPAAQAGLEAGYLENIRISWGDNEYGRGPTGTAIRTGEPQICHDVSTDPRFDPWREEAEKRKIRTAASFPFELDQGQRGVFNLYSSDPAAFTEEEVNLLSQISQDLTFGINFLRSRKAEKRLTYQLEQQRLLTMRTDRLRSLGEMAAGIAHELNQPLMGVRGLTEHLLLALKRGWKVEQKQLLGRLQKIIDQADRMTHIIQHVRSFSKEAGKPRTRPVDINEVIENALELMLTQLQTRGIKVELELQESVLYVEANPFSLEEVILNCLTNAREAIMEKIKTSRNENSNHRITLVTYSESSNENKTVLEIRDTGIGLRPETRKLAFEPFFTTREDETGTGLGLSISKTIVGDHGGTIDIQSETGQETVVTIVLPACKLNEAV